MTRTIAVALAMTGSAALGGCNPFEPIICTLELRPSLVVRVVDSVSGDPVLDPLVWVRDGAFQDTFPAPQGVGRGPSDRERAGTYEVHVEHPDYAPWVETGVRVTEDECHVITREITAALQLQQSGARQGNP